LAGKPMMREPLGKSSDFNPYWRKKPRTLRQNSPDCRMDGEQTTTNRLG
jgi:hypothetical protein